MLPWRRGVFRQNFLFVQDDTSAYVTRDTAASLDKHDVKVMDWPAVCPDMDPLEHVWDYNMVGVAVSMVISTMHVKPYIDSHKAHKFEKKKPFQKSVTIKIIKLRMFHNRELLRLS